MNARIDNSIFRMLFGIVVYLVPICVYLYQSRWLPRLVAPVLDRLRACPRWMLPIIGLFVANMVAKKWNTVGRAHSSTILVDVGTRHICLGHPRHEPLFQGPRVDAIVRLRPRGSAALPRWGALTRAPRQPRRGCPTSARGCPCFGPKASGMAAMKRFCIETCGVLR